MRIAAVTNSRIPSLTANSIQAMKVCDALTALGHDVRIIAPREGRLAESTSLQSHYGLQRSPDVEWQTSWRFGRRLDFVMRARGAYRRFRADLVYTWLPQAAVMALSGALPAVLEVHGDVGGVAGALWLRQFWRQSGSKRMAVTTTALWRALEKATGRGFPPGAVVVAPNGVDLVRYADLPEPHAARQRLGLEQKMTLGFTGHIYPGRGAELLFELARRMPDLQFLWVGGTVDSVSRWRQRLQDEQVANVVMPGFVENRDLPMYQAAADVLLMPYGSTVSASSGQEISDVINPMKMFEYMAAGRAIVTADLPVLHEVLDGTTAVFCRPADVGGWEAALRALLQDEARRTALAAAARLRVQSYTWEARERKILGDLSWVR